MTGSGMPLGGDLGAHSVTSLLQMILDEGRNGCLSVKRGETTRNLYFKGGMLTYASSSEAADRLGEIFVVQGMLTPREVEEAFERARRRQARLGRLLLVEGKITSQELFQGVTAQVVTILERVRSWRKGEFSFEEDREPEAGTVLLRIPLSVYLRNRERKAREKTPLAEPFEEVPFEDETEEPEVAGAEEEVLDDTGSRSAAGEVEGTPGAGDAWGEIVIPEEDEPSEEDQEKLVEEITFNVQELKLRDGGDAFTFLGIKSDVSEDEVDDAYRYFARLLHPDQHPPRLSGETAAEAARLFERLADAYEEARALSTGGEGGDLAEEGPEGGAEEENGEEVEKKTAALTAPPPPGRILVDAAPAVDVGDAARSLFFRAKKQLARGNYWQAADTMRDAVRRKPREALYRNLLGIALMQTGRRLHEAEDHIKEAIRLDPGNPDFVTSLGLVYKAGRFHKKARDMFQQALLYDRNHQQARAEIRKLSVEIETTKKTGNFWKRILGR